jgi:predicted Zn-ribbon and HTH transcriptional regulator
MSYQSRIREIQSSFVMGFQDRETCLSLFEDLLHEYGLLPHEEQLDRTITNENFLTLLKMAKDVREVPPPVSEIEKHLDLESMRKTAENLKKLAERMGKSGQRFRIADSVSRNCPVCQKPVRALFNRVQSLDHQVLPVDPPRCQGCMMKWVEEKFGPLQDLKPDEPAPATPQDDSPVSPMSDEEIAWFASLEKQMQG